MDRSIQEILSRSLYSQGADLLTKRTLQELLKFNHEFDGSIQARDQLVAICDTIYELGNGLTVIHAVILAMIEDHWQEFDQAWRETFNNDFITFVWKRYHRKPNTIRADLRAVRTFLLNDKAVKPFGTIEVPKRNLCGELEKDDTGRCLTQRVEWDPTKSSLAKLKVALPLVENNKMTDKTWALLADDKVSSSQMIRTVYAEHVDSPNPPQLTIQFRMEGPVLTAYQNGNECELGELNWDDYYEDPYSFKHRAMDKLMELLGLTLDENVTLYKESEKQHNDYYHDDQGDEAEG